MPISCGTLEFVRLWNASSTATEVATQLGVQLVAVLHRAKRLRVQAPLKAMPEESKRRRSSENLVCLVQTSLTMQDYQRVCGGAVRASAERVRELILLGLATEEAEATAAAFIESYEPPESVDSAAAPVAADPFGFGASS